MSPGGALADLLQGSHWQIDLGCPPLEAATAVDAFLATESVLVERMTKKGLREFDCRAAVVSLRAEPGPSGTRLQLVLRHTVPAVRPDDVLTGVAATAGTDLGPPLLLTRLDAGSAGRDDRRDRRPARHVGIGVGVDRCAILAVVDVAGSFAHDNPTTFSPVRTHGPALWVRVVARPRRGQVTSR